MDISKIRISRTRPLGNLQVQNIAVISHIGVAQNSRQNEHVPVAVASWSVISKEEERPK